MNQRRFGRLWAKAIRRAHPPEKQPPAPSIDPGPWMGLRSTAEAEALAASLLAEHRRAEAVERLAVAMDLPRDLIAGLPVSGGIYAHPDGDVRIGHDPGLTQEQLDILRDQMAASAAALGRQLFEQQEPVTEIDVAGAGDPVELVNRYGEALGVLRNASMSMSDVRSGDELGALIDPNSGQPVNERNQANRRAGPVDPEGASIMTMHVLALAERDDSPMRTSCCGRLLEELPAVEGVTRNSDLCTCRTTPR